MDEAALSVFGLTESDIQEEENIVWIYPDNWDSFTVFELLGTQWRTASGGVIGLDYNTLPFAFDMLSVDKETQRDVIHDIRVMESTAISILNENNNKR